MDEADTTTNVWEFVSMVDTAGFSTLNHDAATELFEEYVWEVYQVIERRVRASDTHITVRFPSVNKESAVKTIARELSDGIEQPERLARAKAHHSAVPTSTSSWVSENRR